MTDVRLTVVLLFLQSMTMGAAMLSPVSAQTRGGLSAAPGAGMTRGALVTRPARPGSSVIEDGMGGFTAYGSSGSSRYIRGAGAPGVVYDAQGNRFEVIEDGKGNLDIHGPSGSRKVFPARSSGTPDTGAVE